ncbi:MAG: DUF3604 domain-containing protein [Lentisphaeria bacterium]|nr:DUF3604 domain-containing protein [Lentisphaeria bacterium]
MSGMNVYWGDTHDNVGQRPECPVSFDQNVAYAREHLDFYVPALYVAAHTPLQARDGSAFAGKPCQIAIEKWKSEELLEEQWQELQRATQAACVPGKFITFPGYEWQGDGTSGDHNVIHRQEGGAIVKVATLPELYARLQCLDALAIPHHPAYLRGRRGKDWSVHDDRLSPFVEVYSVHGGSETDEECCGLRINSKLGPSVTGGSYQDALDRGCHVGAIASTDGTGIFPGRYNWGLMGCLASELTREAIWEAFCQRRVYGVTGDRIQLSFHVNGAIMGSRTTVPGAREIQVSVRGLDALDRVEVLRNGRVIHTHCHQGVWQLPDEHVRSEFVFRIEIGWGPYPQESGAQSPRRWRGALTLPSGGRVCGFEPCWTDPGQMAPTLSGNGAEFALVTPQATAGRGPLSLFGNAIVFKLEGKMTDPVVLCIDDLRFEGTIGALCRGSHILALESESREMLKHRFGLDVGTFERPTFDYLYAHKVKLHRAVPQVGFSTQFEFVDNEPLQGEANYRIRVEQRNGQKAWSSPVWVTQVECLTEPGQSQGGDVDDLTTVEDT